MDMNQYLEIFIEESKEHLQALNQSLLQLEKNPSDVSMLNEIFRVAHTLKGMSGTMGYGRMAKLTHDMEDVLHALRNSEIKVEGTMIDVLFKCLDALENYLDSIINTGTEGLNDYNEIIKALANIVKKQNNPDSTETDVKGEIKPVVEAAQAAYPTAVFEFNQYEQNVINKAIQMGSSAYKITVVLNKGCLLKSARAFIIFQTLERYSEIIKSVPKVEDIEDERFDFEFTAVVISSETADLFVKELNSISEVEEVLITSLDLSPEAAEACSDESESESAAEKEVNKAAEEAAAGAAPSRAKTGKTVRVDIDRLDVLMNLVSELIITKTKLEGLEEIERSQKFNDEIDTLERITTNLHDAVMKVRMVPVETVFNRFPRMVRDISKELGKEINLIMSGEETELDRTVIDEIGDPLIHLLRNSVDHGIEGAEKRRKSGKPDAGSIYLRAYQSGNNVLIEVEDDGNGIDTEKIRKKLIEKGLVGREVAASLSKNDVIDYLFKPSFSTADKITDISGRGVGLDVVKTKIEALNGSVEVESDFGKGSRFIIRLPLTLAIYQALLVYVGSEKYAIPLSNIERIINVKPDEIQMVQKQEVILLRNTVVPLIRLDKLLEVPAVEKKLKQYTVVIVRKGDRFSGFIVDSVIGQREIVIKTLGKLLSGIKSIAGATILGDGNVALILDVNSIV